MVAFAFMTCLLRQVIRLALTPPILWSELWTLDQTLVKGSWGEYHLCRMTRQMMGGAPARDRDTCGRPVSGQSGRRYQVRSSLVVEVDPPVGLI